MAVVVTVAKGLRPCLHLEDPSRAWRLAHDRRVLPLAGTAQPDGPARREPIALLADVLSRDGAELSASAIRQRNQANADHLGVLHGIWAAETRGADDDRYRDLVMAALPVGYQHELSPGALDPRPRRAAPGIPRDSQPASDDAQG